MTGCDLLKIDVEGYEYNVMESLEELLDPKSIPLIVAEYGPEGMRKIGSTGADLVALMQSKNYKCMILENEKSIQTPDELPLIQDFTILNLAFSSKT